MEKSFGILRGRLVCLDTIVVYYNRNFLKNSVLYRKKLM